MKSRSRFYLYMAILLNIVCFWGFFGTYFGPLLAGTEARFTHPVDQPVIVHVHGWSFFLWYLLLLVQVALIATGRRALHRTFGQASTALVAIAFVTGCIIIPVNIYLGVRVTESPLWPWFGLMILSAVLLFLIFYLPLRIPYLLEERARLAGGRDWLMFSLLRLVESPQFLAAGHGMGGPNTQDGTFG